MADWAKLKQKETTLTVTAEKKEIVTVEPAQETLESTLTPKDSLVQAPPADAFDVNPFAGTDEDISAVNAALGLITTDKEKIKTVTQIRDPAAFALAHMQIEWERQEGAELLAAVDEMLISNIEMLECGRAGKDNRARLFADAIKAMRTEEFEMEKSTGSKLMGSK